MQLLGVTAKRLLLGMRPYSSDTVNYAEDVAPFSQYRFLDYGNPGKH